MYFSKLTGHCGSGSVNEGIKKLKVVLLKTIIVVLLVLAIGVGGCLKENVDMKEPPPDIVWPKPPEIPRIRFVNTISGPENLHIKEGALKTFFRYLVGKPARSMAAPYGVETDSSGSLFIVDTFLKKVHVFDVKGKRYYTFPQKGAPLVSPIDIAIDNERGYLYVTDSQEGVVKYFKDKGKESAGEIGRELLERPTGIAINKKTSELLVVDTVSATVFRYALTDHHLKGKFGGNGSEHGKFHYPTNIHVAQDGTIFVSDSLNFRIQVFSSEGRFVRSFGKAGDSPGYFSRPRGVATDSDGNIYVVDGLFDNIQIFDKEGRLLMAFGGPGHGYGEFWLPTGICIDKNDMIYVSDLYNKRVQVFQYLK